MSYNSDTVGREHAVLDVETGVIPRIAEFMGEIRAPRSYKKAVAIAAYLKKANSREEADAALDIDLLRIVTVAWRSPGMDKPLAFLAKDEEEEKKLLKGFWQRMKSYDGGTKVFVGFNILEFDLPALLRRSLYLLGADAAPFVDLSRYRHPRVIDLMQELSFGGSIKYRTKRFYCRRFGIDIPNPCHGSDVQKLIAMKDWSTIVAHCKADVEEEYALAVRTGLMDDIERRPGKVSLSTSAF